MNCRQSICVLITFAVLLTVSGITACEKKELSDKYIATETTTAGAAGSVTTAADSDNQSEVGGWLTPEAEYRRGDDSGFDDNRLYFSITQTDGSNQSKLWVLVSAETGEKRCICPDPLCAHTAESGCRYLGLEQLEADPDDPDVLYATRTESGVTGFTSAIYRIDLRGDSVDRIYGATLTDGVSENYALSFVSDGQLYFTAYRSEQINTPWHEALSRTVVSWNRLTPSGERQTLDSADGTELVSCIRADKNRLYFIDQNRFYVTKPDLTDETTVLSFDEGYHIYGSIYEPDEGAYYILIASDCMFIESEYDTAERIIYRVGSDLTVERLELPSDKINGFYLTRGYICYTSYEPLYYGKTPRGGDCTDETGGKIYRVARSGAAEPELIFDGHGEIPICGDFKVVGDNLYLDYYEVVKLPELIWFRRAGSTIRVNFAEKTIRWLSFE